MATYLPRDLAYLAPTLCFSLPPLSFHFFFSASPLPSCSFDPHSLLPLHYPLPPLSPIHAPPLSFFTPPISPPSLFSVLVEPLLLQRRLAHLPPPEPAAALAPAPARLPRRQGRLCRRPGPGLSQHRLPDADVPAAAEGLWVFGGADGAVGGGADQVEYGGEGGVVEAEDEEV